MSEQVDTKKEILGALETKYGIVSEACRSIGLSRSTFYDWLSNDSEFKASVDEIKETALDYVEGKLFQKISGVTMKGKGPDEEDVFQLAPSDTAIIFYLKTKGRGRGYIEHSTMDVTSGGEKINGFNYVPPVEHKFPDDRISEGEG